MLTGTPLDLTPFGAILRGIGILYWLMMLAAAALALWFGRRWWSRLILCAAVLAAFIYPVARDVAQKRQRYEAAKARLDASMALFSADCKNAGEKIYHTVDGVDGIVWMRWRDPITNVGNFADQFKLNDPYGQDCGGEDCILRLLRATDGLELDPQNKLPYHKGYRFVESTDPHDHRLYRYTLRLDRPAARDPKYLETFVRPELVKQPITALTASYGVTWDDISSHEDREHWIAGSSLKVIDLQTNQVIAERIGYMIDRGQGSQAGFRSPWLFAEFNACPAFDRSPSNQTIKVSRTRYFIEKTLIPTKGE